MSLLAKTFYSLEGLEVRGLKGQVQNRSSPMTHELDSNRLSAYDPDDAFATESFDRKCDSNIRSNDSVRQPH